LSVWDPLVDMERSVPALMTGTDEAVQETNAWLEVRPVPQLPNALFCTCAHRSWAQAHLTAATRASADFARLLMTLVLRAVTLKTSLGPNIKRSEVMLPADVEQEERRLATLYMDVLRRAEPLSTDAADRHHLQRELLVALQDFCAAQDNPACALPPDRGGGGWGVGARSGHSPRKRGHGTHDCSPAGALEPAYV
jgi:hypothetical protein